MKKVLIANLQMHKNAAGAVRNVLEQIQYFLDHNFEVHLVSSVINNEIVKIPNLIVHKTLPWFKKTGRKRRWWFNYQVERLSKRLAPDLVIGHGDITKQNILTLHNCVHLASECINSEKLSESNEMYQTHTPILTGFPNTFQKLIANSQLMKNDIVKRFNIPEDVIDVVYQSYDSQKFKKIDNVTRMNLREKFSFDDKFVIGLITSGNFKKRGVDIFLEALLKLDHDNLKNIKIIIVGKDTDSDLIKFINEHSLNSIVSFFPVIEDVEIYFQSIDLFVLPARIEEYGRVVIEAMACGCPVLTTSMVGASEILEKDQRKYILNDCSPESLALKIEEALNDKNLVTLGHNNINSALKYSREQFYNNCEKILEV